MTMPERMVMINVDNSDCNHCVLGHHGAWNFNHAHAQTPKDHICPDMVDIGFHVDSELMKGI